MESVQKQVITLSHKVDALYQVIEELNRKVSDALPDAATESNEVKRYSARAYSSFQSTMEHKDILVDGTTVDTSRESGERQLTPEIQIQRLTAQLTAAYNRIAALEEQLLAQRIH